MGPRSFSYRLSTFVAVAAATLTWQSMSGLAACADDLPATPDSSPAAPNFTSPFPAKAGAPRTVEKTMVVPMPTTKAEANARAESLADIYYTQALKEPEPGRAATLYMAAIGEMDKAGTRNDKYATCLSRLAGIELKDNQLEAAEGHIKRSLQASQDHAISAQNYQMLGDIKAKQNELADADRNYSATLELFTKYGDMGHEQAAVLEKLASIYDRMGKTTEANALRVKATDLATFASTNNDAQGLYKQGTKALIANDYPTAIKQFEEALKLQPDFAASKKNLAICYQHEALEHNSKKEYDQAEANYLLALPAMEAAFGAKHAYTCTVLQGLTETLEAENKLDDAEKYGLRWVTIERETNKSGPLVITALSSYSRILKANKKADQALAIDKEINGESLLKPDEKPTTSKN
jgi:tetratricopeptide (TPR) repeat protein